MTTSGETDWLIPEAKRALRAAQTMMAVADYVAVIRECQACIEYCTRAVIQTFGEPGWGHSHARELEGQLLTYNAGIRQKCGQRVLNALHRLAEDDRQAAPWHTRTMYGYRDRNGVFRPPMVACTQPAARRLLVRAERPVVTAEDFLSAWKTRNP